MYPVKNLGHKRAGINAMFCFVFGSCSLSVQRSKKIGLKLSLINVHRPKVFTRLQVPGTRL